MAKWHFKVLAPNFYQLFGSIERKTDVVGILGYLFWPHDAIKLAQKFKAEGTLNEKAIAEYRTSTILNLVLWPLVIFGCFYFSHNHAFNVRQQQSLNFIGYMCLVLAPFQYYDSVWKRFYYPILVFSCGKKLQAEVTNVRSVFSGSIYGSDRMRITYSINDGAKLVTESAQGVFYERGFWRVNPRRVRVGDTQTVYYYAEGGKYKVMPDINSGELNETPLKEKYSFTTANF